MNCIKCGRETGAEQVFCEDCLTEMKKYPVKPNTVVQIPNRPAPVKKSHQRRISPEEQVLSLRKKCRRLTMLLVVSWLLVAALAVAVGVTVNELDFQRFLGQNYTTTDTSAD